MTVSTLNSRDAFVGNDITQAFSTTFQFWDSSDLLVILRTIADGTEATQTEGVDYTVSGGEGTTGVVTFVVIPPSTVQVHLSRVTAKVQAEDLTPLTTFPSAAVEEALDRDVLRIQEIQNALDERYLKIPVTDVPPSGTAPDMTLPGLVERAVSGALMGFDATTGNPTVVAGVTPGTVTVSAAGEDLIDEPTFAAMMTKLGGILAYDSGSGINVVSIALDALGNRDAAATFGKGIFVTGDDRRVYASDGSSYSELVLAQFANASLPAAATVGRILLDTDTSEILRDNGASLDKIRGPFPRGHLAGMNLTVTGSLKDVSISVGQCRAGSSADPDLVNAILAAVMTKELDTAGGWVEGTTNAGRPVAVGFDVDTWFHVFIIAKPDGTTDAGFDTDIDATNLLAEATGYTRFRRIGSVLSDGTPDILDYLQFGDEFIWLTPGTAVGSASSTFDGAGGRLDTLHVPPDVSPMALVNVAITDAGNNSYIYIANPSTDDIVPSQTLSPLASVRQSAAGGHGSQIRVHADASSQVRSRASHATVEAFWLSTVGWTDPRGRYA